MNSDQDQKPQSNKVKKLFVTHGLSLYSLVLISAVLFLLPEQIKWQLYLHLGNQPGQIWQLFSAHFMHISWQHLLGNSVSLILLQQIYGHCFTRFLWIPIALLSAIVISIGLIFISVQLSWYVGLSGLVVALLCFASIVDKQYPIIFNLSVLSLISIYSVFLLTQGEISTGIGLVPVASFSHILGLAAGIVLGTFIRFKTNIGT